MVNSVSYCEGTERLSTTATRPCNFRSFNWPFVVFINPRSLFRFCSTVDDYKDLNKTSLNLAFSTIPCFSLSSGTVLQSSLGKIFSFSVWPAIFSAILNFYELGGLWNTTSIQSLSFKSVTPRIFKTNELLKTRVLKTYSYYRMGKDSRGQSRKNCLVKDCDCEEYERPGEDEGSNKCSYCGWPPAKHRGVETIAAVQDTSPETNSNVVGDGILRPYSSGPKWKDKKFGFVPDAKRTISLFGNKLLPDFYESLNVGAGSNVQLMKRMFIAERDRQ